MSNSLYVKNANRWRDTYNPLRQLTMQRLAALLEDSERGRPSDLQWLYYMIEKRDAILRAGKRHRLAALTQCDWNIREVPPEQLPPGANRRDSRRQAEALHSAYERIDNLKEAIQFLGLAEFRGFSHLEKHFSEANGQTVCTHLQPVPQWFWTRDGFDTPWLYNPSARALSATQAVEINPDTFIIREVTDPINEIAAISFLRRSMSQKDWDGFVETYGIPPLFAEMPPNIPPDREAEYQALAEAVISDARGTLPNGARIQTIPDGSRGTNPFRDHIQYQDSLVVLAITGGKLTTLNESTGIGGGQASVHEQTFRDLAEAEAAEISEIFQRQFDLPLITALFPETIARWGTPLAYFELTEKPAHDVSTEIARITQLASAGYRPSEEEVTARTGYPLSPKQVAPITHRNTETKWRGLSGITRLFNFLRKDS